MGGAAGINMLIQMVRVKFAAILIGTAGVGLLANFTVLQNLIGTVAGLGIQSSAIRDIAAAAGRNEGQAIGRAVLTLRRICWATGLVGAGLIILLSSHLSQWTFGSNDYTFEICLLGLVILLANISGGQMAMIQGMLRIGDLARVNVIGSAFGTIISIGFYVWMGLAGIVPALLGAAFVQLSVSWFFARKVNVPDVSMTWGESFREAGGMVRLGLAFMWCTLMASLIAYLTNALITHQISLEAVGIFSAAFVLSRILVNFVLNAMGADFFPRLTGIASDKEAMNRMVNEQTEIGLLIAVPGLLATMCLAPWVIHIFYTSEFLPAVDLLQWFVLGCLCRVVSAPLGFVQLALGKGLWHATTETIINGFHLVLIVSGLKLIGIEGVAIAYFIAYVFYSLVMLGVARHLTGFRWSTASRQLLLILLPTVAVIFILVRMLPIWPATILGVIVTTAATVLCLRGLVLRVGHEHRLTRELCRIPGMRTMCGLRNTAS